MRELSCAFDTRRVDVAGGDQSDGSWDRLYAASAFGCCDPCRNDGQLRVMSRNQFGVDEHEPVPDQWLSGISDPTASHGWAIQRG